MNPFTEAVWDVMTDHPKLLEELSAIMQKKYEPFLPGDKAFSVNARELEQHMIAELTKWFEWLPETPICYLGGELAMAAMETVEWSLIAEFVLQRLAAAV